MNENLNTENGGESNKDTKLKWAQRFVKFVISAYGRRQ